MFSITKLMNYIKNLSFFIFLFPVMAHAQVIFTVDSNGNSVAYNVIHGQGSLDIYQDMSGNNNNLTVITPGRY